MLTYPNFANFSQVLKKRVTSTAELLDRKMLSRDDKRLHSLMNLVMQVAQPACTRSLRPHTLVAEGCIH